VGTTSATKSRRTKKISVAIDARGEKGPRNGSSAVSSGTYMPLRPGSAREQLERAFHLAANAWSLLAIDIPRAARHGSAAPRGVANRRE
jgi:hypothetical protein